MNLGSTNILYLLLKITSVFIVLLALTRALGKKQMSELTFFNYTTGITIGSIAANIVSEPNQPLINEFIVLTWWCILTELSAYISLKSGGLRRIIDGEPTIVIKKGKLLKHSLKSTRINMDDLSMMLRNQNVFSITEVNYAILEPNGSLSALKKKSLQQVTKEDMNVPTTTTNYIPTEIIADGKILERNLKELNLNEEWLRNQPKQYNINSKEEVFYAEVQSDGTLFVDKN